MKHENGMAEPTTRNRTVLIVRGACLAVGLALIVWALSDHPSIGGGLGFGLTQLVVLGAGVVTAVAAFLPFRIASAYISIFLATVISLSVVELMLQSFFRPHYFTTYDYDERSLFKFKPNTSRVFTHTPENGGESMLYKVNADGFVGPELRNPRPETRIIVYGDSFIHANYTPYEGRFTTVLEDRLANELDGGVEVINAGISGFAPDQILRRMERELDLYEPDLVIVSIFSGNDFGDLLRNRMYGLNASGELEERDFKLDPEQARQVELNNREFALVRIARRALRAMAGKGEAVTEFDPEAWIDAALVQHQGEYESYIAGDTTVGTFAVDPYSTDIAVFPNADSSKTKVELMDAIIGRISRVASDSGTELLFMIVPHPMDLLDGNHSSGRIDPEKYPDYLPTRLTGILEDSVTSHGQNGVNLYPVLQAGEVDELFLKGGDDHWNAAGQAKAADAVAAEVVRILN